MSSAHLAPVPTSVLHNWCSGVERLSPVKPSCPGFYGEQRHKHHAAMLDSVELFGTQAVELGWADLDLISTHAQHGMIRSDYCGVLVRTAQPVQFIDANQIGFGNLTYYWTQIGNPHPRGVPVWAFKG